MDDWSLVPLEYEIVKSRIRDLCLSNLGKTLCDRLVPSSDLKRVKTMLQETSEARVLTAGGAQLLSGLHDVSEPLALAGKGQVLGASDLLRIADTMRGAMRFKRLMRSKEAYAPLLLSYALSIAELPAMVETIEMSIDGDRVSDNADEGLRRVRRAIRRLETRVESRMQSIMGSAVYKDAVQGGYVTQKSGRFVIPVKASQKARFPGTVIAASSSGQTVFIEPASVQPLVNEIVSLRAQEDEIVFRVLCDLTEMVVGNLREISISLEAMAICDFAFAKGRYSREVDGVEPSLVSGASVGLTGARHPLLGKEATPVDVTVGREWNTLVITGPNTGGKTVLLKTVGLFCLLAQSGIHVMAESAALGVFNRILADIGDRQSIEQSLSTFSSRMANIAEILRRAGSGSLVLLDEIGTGTDPSEGSALACSILAHLCSRGCVTVATSHYGDVKLFAESQEGFMNGCVEFDEDTLQPLYTLQIGRAGKSQGITVAERLGLPQKVIEDAKRRVGLDRREAIREQGLPDDHLDSKGGGEIRHECRRTRGQAGSEPDACSLLPPGAGAPLESGGSPFPPREEELRPAGKAVPREKQYLLGDMVYVGTVKDTGRNVKEADGRGNVIVLVKGERVRVNHKRLKMVGKREDLYPDLPNYDLRIVLTSKEDRKLDKAMSKGKVDAVRVMPVDPE